MKFFKRFTFIILLVALAQSCADKVAVPSFVKLEEIFVDSTSYDSVGTINHNTEFVWMYINGNLQGVYKVPFLVPVQNYGEVDVQIRAAIPQLQVIGGSGAAVYPFYTYWNGKVTLTENDTTVLKPVIRYRPNLFIQYKDDFENYMGNPFNLFQKYSQDGIVQYVDNEVNAFEGRGYAEILLLDGESDVIMANPQLWNIPKTAGSYYIEMNFKSNTLFTVGIQTLEQTADVVSYYSSEDQWKKVYIDVTNQVKGLQGGGIRVYFKIQRGAEETGVKWVWIDNFKLVY